jgi:hypothetical protein
MRVPGVLPVPYGAHSAHTRRIIFVLEVHITTLLVPFGAFRFKSGTVRYRKAQILWVEYSRLAW